MTHGEMVVLRRILPILLLVCGFTQSGCRSTAPDMSRLEEKVPPAIMQDIESLHSEYMQKEGHTKTSPLAVIAVPEVPRTRAGQLPSAV